ncbi:MAG TPA: nickel pincer cofactor biosynthesis protein LarC [Dehalococcoidia bacterium]|nr:nickel pincer cofactor biosynthesis protein LarC [Dehalococcoidia bacterium]
MARLAYFDCFSGASGDMILGALVDVGLSVDALREELGLLRLDGYALRSERVLRAGLAATRVHVDVESGDQPQRRLTDILQIIEGSALPAADCGRGVDVFRRLAQAEAAVHGTSIEEVHFHEVGAVDAIVDIMGAVVGLRLLGIDACYASALPAGSGSARSAHGVIPVPGPATLALLASAGAPIREDAGEHGELVTPTGAAILTALARFERPAMRLERAGYGAGGRDPEGVPNVLRLWLGTGEDTPGRRLLQVETNIDDMPAEQFGYVQERLFACGALDVWFSPVQMKKNRPATVISLLCSPGAEAEVVEVLLRETTTLGLRIWEVRRHEAERESLTFASSLGEAAVKIKRLPGSAPRIAPEYDSCREIALRTGLPLAEVYRIIGSEAEARLS